MCRWPLKIQIYKLKFNIMKMKNSNFQEALVHVVYSNTFKIGLCIMALSLIGVNLMAQDFQKLVDQAKTNNPAIKTAVGWLCAVLELIGVVIVANKMFSGKPDAKDGLIGWISAMVFVGIATWAAESALT